MGDKPVCGFIGTGIMGGGMSRNLLKEGFELYVYNRSPEKARELVELGATLCDSPADLASRTEIILICVSNDDALKDVVLGEEGILKGISHPKVVVDHSTVSPDTELFLHKECRAQGVEFLDAPISGGDVGAKNGTLAIMVGGNQESFKTTLPVFESYGKNIVYCGEIGAGQRTKIINQIVVALNVCALSEGLHLAESVGLNLETTLKAIGSGAAGSWSLDNYAPRILKNDLAPGFRAGDMLKDLRIAVSESKESGTKLPGLDLVTTLYEKLSALSATEYGNHALIEIYRKQS